MKFVFSPGVILCGWLGSKHQLTNLTKILHAFSNPVVQRLSTEEMPVELYRYIYIYIKQWTLERNIFRRDLYTHCSVMWIRIIFLTTWKRLVFTIDYKVFWSKYCVEKYFNCDIESLWFCRNMCDFFLCVCV